ncbi:MAG: MotA/TolQ/ExbB proton channel family protein [Kiritimatiellaeota bacterium]|nr:MotA/TolQ/ExbB proton channel family protein [Kiritimatiellota bacterium]
MKNIRFITLGITILLGMRILMTTTDAWAQAQPAATGKAAVTTATTATGDTAGAAPAKMRKMTLWEWFVIGGWCMWPLLACSVVGVGFSIRNYMVLKPPKLLRPELMPPLAQAIRQLDITGARAICKKNPCLFTNILDSGLERAESSGLDIGAMEKAMEEASTEQMAGYMVPINVVNVVAVVAPMWGLLGTVSGMIKAFFNISLGGMGKPEMLANNIGEALITTEAGLLIAIPCMTFYFLFKTNFIKIVAQAGRNIGRLTDLVRPYINGDEPVPEPASPKTGAAPTA